MEVGRYKHMIQGREGGTWVGRETLPLVLTDSVVLRFFSCRFIFPKCQGICVYLLPEYRIFIHMIPSVGSLSLCALPYPPIPKLPRTHEHGGLRRR